MALPKMITSGDVMEALHISRPTLYRLIDTGELPATKVGPNYRFDEDEIRAYLTAGRTTKAAS